MSDSSLPDFDSLWDYHHPEETERRFREILPLAANGGDRSYHAQLLTQIARCLGLQRRFDEAHRLLDDVQQELTEDVSLARIRYLLERGRVFNSSKQPDAARPLFLQAWESACAAGEDGFAVDAAHMLGIVETGDQQLEWNLKALALAENSPQPRAQRWLGSLYNNIGWTYHSAGQYEKSLEIFAKALRWREEKDAHSRETRIARWCVARALRSIGRLEVALAMQRALLIENEKLNEPDGFVYEEIAECLLAQDRVEEARQYFALAYQELAKDPSFSEDEPARWERLKTQAGSEV